MTGGAMGAGLRRFHAGAAAEQAVAKGLRGDLSADAERQDRPAKEGVRVAFDKGGGHGLVRKKIGGVHG